MATPRTSGNSRRILATVAAIGAVGALGAGTFSAFTGSTAVNQSITSGTMTLTPGAGSSLDVAATDIAPGDTIERGVNIIPGGTVDASGFTLTVEDTSGIPGNVLVNPTFGLQLKVETCTAMPVFDAVARTTTCAGATEIFNSTVPGPPTGVQQYDLALPGLATTAGSNNYMRVTTWLPTTADNAFQAQSAALRYTFNSAQRAGVNK